jgi:hypothetical protein
MLVSQFGTQANDALISGLRCPDEYYQVSWNGRSRMTLFCLPYLSQSFAFGELATLTLTDAARRKAIFADIKGEANKKGAWAEICRESLKLIGTELQRAKGRGASQGKLMLRRHL